MLRKLFLSGWYILVAILILFAIVMSVVRGYPSIYQHYLPEIQQNISSILGKPVHVDSIRIDWHGITPQITTRNLSIFEDDDRYDQLLNVDKAIISIDIFKSIARSKVILNQLTFVGGNLEAIRTEDERILLNGIDISERLAERKKLNQSNKLKINLLNSSISIIDEVKKLDYFFDRVDVELKFSGDHFKVSSRFMLPKTLGDSLILSADIRDLDKGFKNIKGKLYSKGDNINLELLNDFFPKLQVGIHNGVSDFQVWGNFNSLKQRTFVGRLGLDDLVYKDIEVPIKNVVVNEEIISIDTGFKFQGDIEDWRFALNDVSIKTATNEWPGKQYEFSCVDCGQQNFTISAALDYMDTDQLLSTLQHFPFIVERLNDVLDKIEIHGVLNASQLSAQFNNNRLTKYAYRSSLQQANISIPAQGITVTSIVGEVMGDHRKGEINLTCDSLGLKIDKILSQTLHNQILRGTVHWQHIDGNVLLAMQELIVGSNEMVANLQGILQIIENKPYVDIQINVPHVKAETIKQYFPYKRMKPKLSRWLSESIEEGTLKDGKLLFHGNPKNFPFKNKPGRFEISAKIENGVLAYRPNWPVASDIIANLEIKNNYLEVSARQGTILDSSITRVHAYINDLKLPRLILNGNAAGPASNILQFLQQSSILPEDSKVIKHITASGNTKLDLDLSLTLTKKLEKQILVGGVVEFVNAGLTVNALSLPFTDLNGKLSFDKSGAEGSGLSAMLYGAPIIANARKENSGRTLLSVSGDFDLDTYFSSNYSKFNKYIKGIAPVSAQINIPRFGKNNTDKTLLVNIDSDLYGATTLLPEPFKKAFDESKNISIQTRHPHGLSSEIFASLENQVFMQAIIDKNTSELSSMELRMGNKQFNLPEEGVKISGRMNNFNISDWRELMQSEEDHSIEVKEIDIFVNSAMLGGLNLENVDFHATKNTQFWVGDIISSVAKGKFEYPIDAKSGSVATANFDYLRFKSKQKILPSSKSTQLDPRTLPALVVNAKEFEYKDAVFNGVSLKTKPSANGLTIDSLQGSGRELQVSANGIWAVDTENMQETKLTIRLVSQNLQNSLAGLGFGSSVSGGEGGVVANFTWPKAPYQFSLESVTGDANLRFKDGAISSVEPGGAGRLVGLFNFGEISKRLSLDFTDFFSKGYAFEKIRGDLKFENANLTTENLKINGPSADLLIQGRTGIEAQDYDQVVTVTPHVSGGLPWIGLAVGGPLGAVGVLVGEKIAKSIGVDVNKVTEVKYTMKGSWQEPVIEPIAQKIAEKKSVPQVQGQPSPDSIPRIAPAQIEPNTNRIEP
ncbi:MAG: TIGR02099 family protein [Gammaproteobacteria bacterium]|nr:MAG: TIGR02099 family protein [Gammaproteobacteria bacterium]